MKFRHFLFKLRLNCFYRLAAYGGVRPISSSGSPVASVNLEGQSWDLWEGYNGAMKVYSFVAKNAPLRAWGGDVKRFFDYLAQNKGYPAGSQYLISKFRIRRVLFAELTVFL